MVNLQRSAGVQREGVEIKGTLREGVETPLDRGSLQKRNEVEGAISAMPNIQGRIIRGEPDSKGIDETANDIISRVNDELKANGLHIPYSDRIDAYRNIRAALESGKPSYKERVPVMYDSLIPQQYGTIVVGYDNRNIFQTAWDGIKAAARDIFPR